MYLKKGTRQGVERSPWHITKSKVEREAEYICPNRFVSKKCTLCFKKFLIQCEQKLCMCFIIMKGNVEEVPELNEILENKYTS